MLFVSHKICFGMDFQSSGMRVRNGIDDSSNFQLKIRKQHLTVLVFVEQENLARSNFAALKLLSVTMMESLNPVSSIPSTF